MAVSDQVSGMSREELANAAMRMAINHEFPGGPEAQILARISATLRICASCSWFTGQSHTLYKWRISGCQWQYVDRTGNSQICGLERQLHPVLRGGVHDFVSPRSKVEEPEVGGSSGYVDADGGSD